MISLLCDFAYVPMTHKRWDKVLNKWRLNSGVDAIGQDRSGIIDEMQHLQKFINSKNEKPNLEFLKKYYIEPKTNKKRKLVTGIAAIPKKDSEEVVVSLLVGNPKSTKDPRFKGTLDSLDKKVGKRNITIQGINDKVDNIYKKKFGDRLIE